MPFLPFNFPFFYNNYKYKNISSSAKPNTVFNNSEINNTIPVKDNEKKDSERPESSESFFEIFGLKLYYDDILILCILFFLYTEKVQDEELFICLILLLLT